MFTSEVQRVMDAFKRYQEFSSELNDIHEMIALGPIRSHSKSDLYPVMFKISDYSLMAWIDANDELHIINPDTRESIFDYAEEYDWSKEDVQYMRFGVTAERKEGL